MRRFGLKLALAAWPRSRRSSLPSALTQVVCRVTVFHNPQRKPGNLATASFWDRTGQSKYTQQHSSNPSLCFHCRFVRLLFCPCCWQTLNSQKSVCESGAVENILQYFLTYDGCFFLSLFLSYVSHQQESGPVPGFFLIKWSLEFFPAGVV